MNNQLIRSLICLSVPIAILLCPVPSGLTKDAWVIFAFYAASIVGLILRPFPEPVVLMAAMAGIAIFYGKINLAMGGFANSITWLVFVAFLVGQAFVDTGLGRRIAYVLIRWMGQTSLKLGYVVSATDGILALAIPSNTARTGGLGFPIFHNVSTTLDSHPGESAKRIGAYLMVMLYQVSLASSCLFMTANANNPLVISFSKNIMNFDMSWIQWAMAMVPPGIVVLAVIPWITFKLCPATLTNIDSNTIAKEGLEKIGPMSSKEKTLCVVFALAVLGWATGSITKIDTTSVAMGFLVLCLVTGVVKWSSLLKNEAAWSTFIWYGGIISFANGLSQAKFFQWLSKVIQSNIDFSGMSPILVLIGIIFISVAIRYFFASVAAFVSSMIPVFMTFGIAAQVPPAALTLMLAASALMGSLTTHYGNGVGPIIFGLGYVEQGTWWKVGHVVAFAGLAIYFVLGLPWWKLLGLW